MKQVEVAITATEDTDSVDARVTPTGSLENLSQQEVDRLLDSSRGGLYALYRRCSLAVLNAGGETDDARAIFQRYEDFDIRIVRQAWGVKLELSNAPASAFVDGRMIRGIQEHLFAVLRDVLYVHGEVYEHGSVELREPQGITNAVYRILRNAGVLRPRVRPDIVVCWGGHSIGREEYDYTKRVGYELGLRGLNVCTGCGPGAMKGPMKGATIGHSKQRIQRRALHRHHGARHRRGRTAQRHREPARDHSGHREASRGIRAHRPRHRGVSRRGRHGRGDPLPDGDPARPGQRAAAVPGGVHRS